MLIKQLGSHLVYKVFCIHIKSHVLMLILIDRWLFTIPNGNYNYLIEVSRTTKVRFNESETNFVDRVETRQLTINWTY